MRTFWLSKTSVSHVNPVFLCLNCYFLSAALIAILMANLTDGLVGLALSTLSIVVVGEIIPQAACSRHGLFIGANTVWIVKIFIFLMYVVARPISMILDRVLGRDIGQVYSAAELNKLIRIHVENPDAQEESGLNKLMILKVYSTFFLLF